jgi:hypothetical protein
MTKEQQLFEFCQKFITENKIWGAERVYQSDSVAENFYEFVDGVCKIVGYIDDDEEDE